MYESTAGRVSSEDIGPSLAERCRRWLLLRAARRSRVLERNAQWAAEARCTPPLYEQESA